MKYKNWIIPVVSKLDVHVSFDEAVSEEEALEIYRQDVSKNVNKAEEVETVVGFHAKPLLQDKE